MVINVHLQRKGMIEEAMVELTFPPSRLPQIFSPQCHINTWLSNEEGNGYIAKPIRSPPIGPSYQID